MNRALMIIVIAQFFGTSLWFSANAAADDLMRAWGLSAADLGRLTAAVQGGFIAGTLLFAVSEAFAMIGKAAHICGAAPGLGSRRYVASMTPEERKRVSLRSLVEVDRRRC